MVLAREDWFCLPLLQFIGVSEFKVIKPIPRGLACCYLFHGQRIRPFLLPSQLGCEEAARGGGQSTGSVDSNVDV